MAGKGPSGSGGTGESGRPAGTPVGNWLFALTGLALLAGGVYFLVAAGLLFRHPGADLYERVCIACHGTGVAGAPMPGDPAAWGPRLALGPDRLLQTAIAGKGAMPPRGSCGSCSDDELRTAIEYMTSNLH